jgi:membrane protein DedA with SNARE-associated domain
VNPSMASITDFLVVLAVAFGANMIPFAGPSNLLIPTWFPFLLVGGDTATLLAVGVIVAFAASIAKGIYYVGTFFVSKHLSEKRRARLDEDGVKVKRWAFLLLFVAAATPIPDEPVVIPLGLMKYSIPKFFTAYFLGKLTIAIAGAFLGNVIETTFAGVLTTQYMIILSVVLTIVITVILLKVDFGKLAERFLKKKPKEQSQKPN